MTKFEKQTLFALFCLSRDNRRTDAGALAAALDSTPTSIAHALLALEVGGLVDASRARLTMLGLAAAVRGGSALGGSQIQQRRPPLPVTQLRLPVAAQPAQPGA